MSDRYTRHKVRRHKVRAQMDGIAPPSIGTIAQVTNDAAGRAETLPPERTLLVRGSGVGEAASKHGLVARADHHMSALRHRFPGRGEPQAAAAARDEKDPVA